MTVTHSKLWQSINHVYLSPFEVTTHHEVVSMLTRYVRERLGYAFTGRSLRNNNPKTERNMNEIQIKTGGLG